MIDYTSYVNIKQGTLSEYKCSNGNTLPLVTAPFGMNAYTIQTRGSAGGWFYNPYHMQLEGFKLTHQPSPWVGDYAPIVFMPQSGKLAVHADSRTSGFSEMNMNPAFMEVYLKRYRAAMGLTATERCAIMNITWDTDKTPRFYICPIAVPMTLELHPETGELYGTSATSADITHKDFKSYFYMKFDRPINMSETFSLESPSKRGETLSVSGKGVGMNIGFNLPMGETLKVILGTSYISHELAKENALREIGDKSYEDVKAETKQKWNELLSKIRITDTEEKMKTFYSCFYRCFLYPRIFFEYDKDGKPIHFATGDASIKEGVMYTDNGFWDTYRSLFPLYTLIMPERMKEMLEGFLNFYKEEGWLPKWLSPGERGMMPGSLLDVVLTDAAAKGMLTKEQMKLALEGMLKNAEVDSGTRLHGRIGLTDYCELGYVPCDKHGESVNNSLDAYYCDYCISKIADMLGEKELSEKYFARSQNYKLLFDEEVGFIHGRNADGTRKANFSPIVWGGEFCEGAAWQNAFAVAHDVDGLAGLYGGYEGFTAKLDELFSTPPVYEIGTYYTEIHEMTEMALADFGQCAISNQPSFHLPYLYSMVGHPEKTAYWVNRLVNDGFSSKVDGLPGDEDNGSMGAWYVFATLGFYPVCPGNAEYITGVCNAERAEVDLWNGRTLTIENELKDAEDYQGIQVCVDDTVINNQKISHNQLLNGSVIRFYK